MYKYIFFALTICTLPVNSACADGGNGLIQYMGALQYFGHKSALAIDNQNQDLIHFYGHELEETIEQIEEIKSFDGFPISKLVQEILLPAFKKFETAYRSGDWGKTSTAFNGMIIACNSCHNATNHSFIVIQRRSDNPFMQLFSKQSSSNPKLTK